METAKAPCVGIHGSHNQEKKFLCLFHKTKFNKHLLKKLGQMESGENVANCEIWYFEKSHHKVNKVKVNKIS